MNKIKKSFNIMSVFIYNTQKGEMHMRLFLVGESNLTVRKENLEALLHDVYYQFYKKDRVKHLSKDDDRLPDIKITGDLVSFSVWFKDRSGNEHKMMVDGTCFLNDITLDTFTFEHKELNNSEYTAYITCLKKITSVCDGFMMVSTNGKPGRIKAGEFDNQKALLKEIFEKVPNESKEEIQVVFDWLLDCTKKPI